MRCMAVVQPLKNLTGPPCNGMLSEVPQDTKHRETWVPLLQFCVKLITHPHLLVRATSERFLPAGALLQLGLVSESHWLQPVLVLTVH
jgi:hypothetical protein